MPGGEVAIDASPLFNLKNAKLFWDMLERSRSDTAYRGRAWTTEVMIARPFKFLVTKGRRLFSTALFCPYCYAVDLLLSCVHQIIVVLPKRHIAGSDADCTRRRHFCHPRKLGFLGHLHQRNIVRLIDHDGERPTVRDRWIDLGEQREESLSDGWRNVLFRFFKPHDRFFGVGRIRLSRVYLLCCLLFFFSSLHGLANVVTDREKTDNETRSSKEKFWSEEVWNDFTHDYFIGMTTGLSFGVALGIWIARINRRIFCQN